MDTAHIRELASEIRELDRKVGEMRGELQHDIRELDGKLGHEIRELDRKVLILRIDALTKDQAIAVAFVVWVVALILAIASRG